jgi:TetR/AcrR family transcriptional regulator, transcriptional repressor for nem operon
MAKLQDEIGTAARILDIAEGLVQTRGFNGFSYADVAGELRVTTASLHYHFRGKAELGEALITRYTARFMDALEAIAKQGGTARSQLEAYTRIYGDVLRRRRMCLCGMLAADYDTLPESMRSAVVQFFDANERWLIGVLKQGARDGSLAYAGPVEDVAQSIVSGLEGAILIARPYGDVTRFEAAAERLLAGLTGTGARLANRPVRAARRTG